MPIEAAISLVISLGFGIYDRVGNYVEHPSAEMVKEAQNETPKGKIKIGMPIADAVAILGEPSSLHPQLEGKTWVLFDTPACVTYRIESCTVTVQKGKVVAFSDIKPNLIDLTRL